MLARRGTVRFWNIGMQMLQQPHQITILYSFGEVRHVRLNQPHPAQVTPSWYGDSVGHYEGDTLVIDTVGIKADRPFAMIDMYGTPYTQALHVVERYRLLDYEAAKEAEERGEKENFRLAASDAGFARNPDYKGKGVAAPIHRRGRRRLHDALVRNRNLSAPLEHVGRLAGIRLRRKLVWILPRKESRDPDCGQTGFLSGNDHVAAPRTRCTSVSRHGRWPVGIGSCGPRLITGRRRVTIF